MAALKRLMLVLVLIVSVLSVTPGRVNAGGENPPLTTAQQRRADRLKLEYDKLKTDLNDLGYVYEKVAGYRSSYFGYLTSEQYHKHDTKVLEEHLSPVDSFIKQGLSARQSGIDALSDMSGLDNNGNVIDINKVGTQIQNGLSFLLIARGYAVRAVYYMHSAVNLYQQITGLVGPDIPKLRLEPYNLSSAVTATQTPVPLSASQQRVAGRLGSKYSKLKTDLTDLQALYDKAASYRAEYTKFLNSEQFNKRDTTILEQGLTIFDSNINIGAGARQNGLALLNGNGIDSNGNVTNINTVDNAVRTALSDYLKSRDFLVSAIFRMHSALNRYHQVWGVDVPDVPNLHLPPYLLTP